MLRFTLFILAAIFVFVWAGSILLKIVWFAVGITAVVGTMAFMCYLVGKKLK